MERIYQSALRLMASLTLEEVWQRSVEEGCKLLDARYGSIFWYEDGKLRRVYTNIPKSHRLEPRPRGNTIEVFLSRKPKFLSSEEVAKGHPHFKDMPAKSISLIPLMYAEKSLGVMSLQSAHEVNYVSRNMQRLLLLGSLVSLAIRNVQLYEQKKEALNQRDLFMSLASHELKTPLAVVIMTLHLIERKMKAGATFDQQWLETIKRNTNKLKTLIDDLFSISQINAGTIRTRRSHFSIVAMCEKVASELATMCKRKIILKDNIPNELEVIHADEEKMSLVVTNIISNAIKFSPDDSPITISLDLKWTGIEIKVKDQGIGVDKIDQKRVFDRYFQGKNRGNGLGLGLFLSKEIVEAHDGEIFLRSQKGKGTTVSMWLPFTDNA